MWLVTVLGVAVGGALGALSRYGLTLLLEGGTQNSSLKDFPLATLLINVVGSFLLAVVVTLLQGGVLSPAWRTALGTGFLGAFTTFSTFALDTDTLLSRGDALRALIYVCGNLILGFLAIGLGRALTLNLFLKG